MITKETLTIPIHSDFLTDKVEGGLTIRMMIAASAMNGILANHAGYASSSLVDEAVERSFAIADAMIDYDNKTKNN